MNQLKFNLTNKISNCRFTKYKFIIYFLLTFIFAFTSISNSALTLNTTPDSVPADGTTSVEIAAQLLDSQDHPLANQRVFFTTTNGQFTRNRTRTDSNGLAYTKLTSTQPGEAIIEVITQKETTETSVFFTEVNSNFSHKEIFALSGGSVDAVLANPEVEGYSMRLAWVNLEPQEGVFNWSSIDDLIYKAEAAGKKISIAIHPGTSTPDWVYQKGVRILSFLDDNPFSKTYGQMLYCPMPWDEVFLEEWGKFINALGNRYKDNSVVAWVRISGPMNTTSIEWDIPEQEEWYKYIGTQDEWSEEKFITAVQNVIDIFASAFPSKPLSIALAKTKVSEPPPFLIAATTVADYGFATYPDQFRIQMNGWNAQVPDINVETPDTELFKKYAPNTGSQMIWSATNDPECRMNGRIKPCDPYSSLEGAILKAIDYNLSFLEIYVDDILNPSLQPVLEMF